MSLQVEKMEHNMAKLTVEVPADELEKAIDGVYQKTKKNIAMPGFRKGKAPRHMIERMYGKGVFLEDAANDLLPNAYAKAVEESELEVVSRPAIEVTQIEPGKPFVFVAEVALKPDVTLGEYKGVEVAKVDVEVKDEEVDEELRKEQEKNSRLLAVEDRPAENGDIVTMDYEGFIDGKSFPGAQGKDYPLMIGSGAFIPGFEEQLIGAKVDEPTEVNVTFPENYSNKELIGKDATFKCVVHKIEKKEIPELDDEFAMDVSEFDTLDEYKEDIKKNLLEKKEEDAKRKMGDDALAKIIEASQMEIPEPMIETQQAQLKDDFRARIEYQGITLDHYLTFNKMTMEELDKELRERTVDSIQSRLVLEKIAEVENIQATQEQIDEEIQKTADMYRMDVDKVKEMVKDDELEQIKKDLAVRRAADLIVEAAVLTDK